MGGRVLAGLRGCQSLVQGIGAARRPVGRRFRRFRDEFHTSRVRQTHGALRQAGYMDTVKKVLRDAKMKPEQIHGLVMVGGSTRVPKLQGELSEFFGGKELCQFKPHFIFLFKS